MLRSEWISSVSKASKCAYKEYNRHLKEQIISGINDEMMTAEIIKLLTKLRKTNDVASVQVLTWAKRIGLQRIQRAIMSHVQENSLTW